MESSVPMHIDELSGTSCFYESRSFTINGQKESKSYCQYEVPTSIESSKTSKEILTSQNYINSSTSQNHFNTSTSQNHVETSQNQNNASTSQDQAEVSTSKDETLVDILSDLPEEILSGCGPEEAFRPDYKSAIFPQSRPPNTPMIEPTPSIFHEEEIFDPDDNFYFESDHLALKDNKDYRDMLRVIVTLQAQRTQAIKDLDVLLAAKKEALADPIAYVAKLQSGNLPEYPGPQKIAELPVIDWTKYNVAQPDANMRPTTRHGKAAPQPKEPIQDNNEDKILVRGRVYDDTKPETFNKLWTADEQRRLEQLLIEYPPEDVEMRRWTKIANALGNRTPIQVSSRVQKYFKKLTEAGYPIPGRGPKAKRERRRGSSRRYSSFRKSTFFPHEEILDEITKQPAQEQYVHNESESKIYSHEPIFDKTKKELMQEEFNDDTSSIAIKEENPILLQIELLRKIKNEKDINIEESAYHHLGYKCYICGEEPIKGIRWHCEECLDEIDLCSDCAVAQLEAEDPLHPSTHKLLEIRPPKYSECYDTDYLPQNFSTTSYNYLDPNFLPLFV